jgi:hypothetical protein
VIVDALATFRLAKLATDDQLTAEARDAVIRWAYGRAGSPTPEGVDVDRPGAWADDVVPNDPDPPKLAILASCPWCAGAWIALGVVIARRVAPRPWRFASEVFALSAVAGLVAEGLDRVRR